MIKILTTIFAILFTLPAMAITVSGTVVDESNQPMIGAAIIVSGTSLGTTSDANGKFELKNDQITKDSKLEISFLGYKSETINASDNIGTIKLKEDAQQAEAVVVTSNDNDLNGKPCSQEYLTANIPNATNGTWSVKNGKQTCNITECLPNYKPNKHTNTCFKSEPCNATQLSAIFAKSGHTDIDNKGNTICVPDECNTPQYELVNGKCQSTTGKKCTASDTNATKAEYNDKAECIIKSCKGNYRPSDNGTACEPTDGPCSDDQVKAIEHATKGELKKSKCYATECESGFEEKDGKCIAIAGKCDDMPENAKSAHREYDSSAGAEVCIVDTCDDGCKVASDKKSCNCPKLSEEDSQKKIDELKENAQAMKDKEQSTAARMTSAAAMGGMGIGGMQAMSAMAEKSADEDAERDMRAYLATFRCDYGQGRNIQGGEKQIELPGGNALYQLNQEYKTLATDLKIRKNALGMRAGIESEHIEDKATTGLYDDVSLGKTGGAYTSLSRALSDENSKDAAEWAAQKSATSKKLKTGAIVAGVGAVVGLAGNIAIEATGPKNQANAINAKYDKLKKLVETTDQQQAALPSKKCSEFTGTTGTGESPNCACSDTNARFFPDNGGCVSCTDGKQYNENNECACPADKPVENNGKCVAQTPNCKLTGMVDQSACECIDGAFETAEFCDCLAGYTKENGKCIKPQFPTKIDTNIDFSKFDEDLSDISKLPLPTSNKTIFKFDFDADKLFEPGKSTISGGTNAFMQQFNEDLEVALIDDNVDLKKIEYCVTITGHTDRTQFKSGSSMNNTKLSQQRADTIKRLVSQNNNPFNATNIKTYGAAEAECPKDKYTAPNDSQCRRVAISVTEGKCK